MKNKIVSNEFDVEIKQQKLFYKNVPKLNDTRIYNTLKTQYTDSNDIAEILVITSYPPRECSVATYSHNLLKALNDKFSNSLSVKVCAVETEDKIFLYPSEVKYIINTSKVEEYKKLAININNDDHIKIVLIQHKFEFYKDQEQSFKQFLNDLSKPIVIVFHNVIDNPDEKLKSEIKSIIALCESVVVMTNNSSDILINKYDISQKIISVIAHGTHLVSHLSKNYLKMKYGLKDRKVLTTFGYLSSNKSIETTLDALPAIVKSSPDVVFLVIGKTHPEVVKKDGETYRLMLEHKVDKLSLRSNVVFFDKYMELPELFEYLQLTDIYLFTANDINQEVSVTFAYAMSCSCPIISTPIPQAKEFLTSDTGIVFDFNNSEQLANSVISLLKDDQLRRNISLNTLQKIVSTAWENSAVSHVLLFEKISDGTISIHYNLPVINLSHLKQMTTNTGIIQFSKINQPDINSGYTLDDNARALITTCMYLKLTRNQEIINEIRKYLAFIKLCQQPAGNFLNYVDKDNIFTDQNKTTNLDDVNGRAIWALGYVASLTNLLPREITSEAEKIIKKSLMRISMVHSTHAIAFIIKGLYFYHKSIQLSTELVILKTLADRLVQMYKNESTEEWEWLESHLTNANSILPEALLYTWLITKDEKYKEIAITSFKFLLSQTFSKNSIEVNTNRSWLHNGRETEDYGEHPIDVAYTIITLSIFYDVFLDEEYLNKMKIAFSWFLGNNRLHQIIYNPCTGGCYDALEETRVNINQGAESTVSYLMARLTMEKYNNIEDSIKT